MKTIHRAIYRNARRMGSVDAGSVDLVVTSPPYPMIEMWDEIFSQQDPAVKQALSKGDGASAFERMHALLDEVWREVYRVLKPGGFACINIGDATRTVNGNFALYANHARILNSMQALGFTALPCVLWRKQTNAPNKFMGSGMLPAGAYVTLEHEYVLILRKGPKRDFFKAKDKQRRRQSAIFWEERNRWYSDVWFDIKGTPQRLADKNTRKRSGAYPFELVYRLISMYSVKNDLVLDPFLGTGTTMAAAMAAGRSSIGFEIDGALEAVACRIKDVVVDTALPIIRQRLVNHMAFVVQRLNDNGLLKHRNSHYGFPVITSQERELLLNDPLDVSEAGRNLFEVAYSETPQAEFCRDWEVELDARRRDAAAESPGPEKPGGNVTQLQLF